MCELNSQFIQFSYYILCPDGDAYFSHHLNLFFKMTRQDDPANDFSPPYLFKWQFLTFLSLSGLWGAMWERS